MGALVRLDQSGAGPGHPGRERKEGLRVLPAAKVSDKVTPTVAIGLAYYGALGPVRHFDRAHEQLHQLFPVIDLDVGPKWEFNAGIGFGLTPRTDRLVFKMILGYRFDWGGGGHK